MYKLCVQLYTYVQGMDVVGDLFGSGKMFLPQVCKPQTLHHGTTTGYLPPFLLSSFLLVISRRKVTCVPCVTTLHSLLPVSSPLPSPLAGDQVSSGDEEGSGPLNPFHEEGASGETGAAQSRGKH